jgi:fumarylacetoacetate (FAA) hydrolase
MKLATLKKGGRDGTLVVVSRNLANAVEVPLIARTLQAAIDDWQETAPRLKAIYDALNEDRVDGAFALDTAALAAPLPRAYQFADGSAYVQHVQLVRAARGATVPDSYWDDPLMYQAVSYGFMGPNDPILIEDEAWGVDYEAELVAVTDDVPMGCKAASAPGHLILFMLINDVTLRNLVPAELKKEFGFFQSKPVSTLSPVAVTADEFGEAWDGRTLDLELTSTLRGELFGHPRVSVDQTFGLDRLVEHCAKSRALGAGSLIGTGTISNVKGNVGSSCIAEKRAFETLEHGSPQTPFMRFGDSIRIEMFDRNGASIFGAIDQKLEKYTPPA